MWTEEAVIGRSDCGPTLRTAPTLLGCLFGRTFAFPNPPKDVGQGASHRANLIELAELAPQHLTLEVRRVTSRGAFRWFENESVRRASVSHGNHRQWRNDATAIDNSPAPRCPLSRPAQLTVQSPSPPANPITAPFTWHDPASMARLSKMRLQELNFNAHVGQLANYYNLYIIFYNI